MYTKADVTPISSFLLKSGQTIAVAESVTSGHLQAAFSLADYAQEFYQGGITAYNVGQKARHLGVEPIHAQAHNAVSKQVAEQMALGAVKKFSSHWGLGICGYAAPVPELKVKVPYAHFALVYLGAVKVSRKLTTKTTSGRPTQEYYVKQILQAFASVLK